MSKRDGRQEESSQPSSGERPDSAERWGRGSGSAFERMKQLERESDRLQGGIREERGEDGRAQ